MDGIASDHLPLGIDYTAILSAANRCSGKQSTDPSMNVRYGVAIHPATAVGRTGAVDRCRPQGTARA